MNTNNQVDILIRATDQASKTIQHIGGQLTDMGAKSTTSTFALNAAMVGLGIAIGVAAAAASAFTAVMAVGIRESMQMQEATAQLNARLTSTSYAAGVSKQSVIDLGTALQSETRFSDDAVVSASNLMLTFTNIKKDVFPEAIRAATDMSAALGQDMKSSVLQLGKALQDPIGGLTALRRVGVMFTDQQEAMVKQLVASGRGLEAQKMILQEIQTEFGGAAEAAGGTLGGQLERLTNKANDLAEKLGAALMPGLQAVAQGLLDAFADPRVQAAMDELAVTISENIVPAMMDFGDWLATDFITALDTVLDKVREVTDALGGFMAEVGKVLQGAYGTIQGAFAQEGFMSDFAKSAAAAVGTTGKVGLTAAEKAAQRQAELAAEKAERQDERDRQAQARGWSAMRDQARAVSGYIAPTFSMPKTSAADKTGEPTYADKLMAAFGGNVGAAMAWEGAFASEHGGAKANATNVRDYMASQMFAKKHGRGPTQEEWEKRYYEGEFEGIDESGLDAFFGKSGTLTTLLEKQVEADVKHFADLQKSAESGNWKVQLFIPPAPEGPPPPPPGGETPGYATGGLVNYPTLAYLAEKGPEMVVPLKAEDRSKGNVGVNYNLNIYSAAKTESVVADFNLLKSLASVMR